jgi:cytochrome oxidase Cu insertion factor (SCO1/SenC/PrrC family)
MTDLAAHDVMLVNQDGQRVHFYGDLVKGRIAAINSIFTTCTTICNPMGANFAALEKLLGSRAGKDVNLISISVDPLTDTPEKLKAWRAKFKGGSGWTLLTGEKRDVDHVLQELGVFTPDKLDHTSVLLLGDARTGDWKRLSALTAPAKIAAAIDGLAAPQAELSPAHRYFTDVPLLTQDGKSVRFYSDLLEGKTVIINSFFSTCNGSCPMMAATFARIQKALGDRLGKDVYLLSISVDPETDTPQKLKEYAERFHAKPGWYFLTGDKQNVQFALEKIGQYVEEKTEHFNMFIIGNEKTGLWKKAFGLASPDEILKIVDSVLTDRG